MPSTGTRMFVAVRPPEAALEDLDEFLAPRRDAGTARPGFRWSAIEQVHLTLAFLPAVADHAVDDLLDRLADAAGRRTGLVAAVAGGGAFPDAARARVLYAGLGFDDSGASELARLALGCRTAATRAGLEVDGQRFRPHLTLARLARPDDVTRWLRVLDTYRGPAWTVDRVELVASHLGEGPRGGPRHEIVAEVALVPPGGPPLPG